MASTTEPSTLKIEEEEDSRPSAEDEDTGAQVSPIVKLQEVAVTTGEENENILLDLKAKLYRFDKEGNQWKERGVGTVKLLKHEETGKVRLVMRQNKTLKICANHLVFPTMTVQEHHGNDKSCVWHAADFADGDLKEETFCIRFASVEMVYEEILVRERVHQVVLRGQLDPLSQGSQMRDPGAAADSNCRSYCKSFKEKIEEITESLAKDNGESKEAETAVGLIEKLSVEGKDKEEKTEAKEAAPTSPEEKRDETEKHEKSGEEK